MKPVIIIAIVVSIAIITVVIVAQSYEDSRIAKLNECASILNQFKLGLGSGINEHNEIVFENHDRCMNEYREQYPNTEETKLTVDDFDPKFASHFSGLNCYQDEYGFVNMYGQFTNGEYYYNFIYFKIGIIDEQGRVVATGVADVRNIQPYETKIFEGIVQHPYAFKECIIEIDFVG